MTRSLHEWVELWFGPRPVAATPAELVRPLLTFNNATKVMWTEGDVEVLVSENQGVWLWGQTSTGQLVERENEPGVPWEPIDEDLEAFWLHHAAFEAVTSLDATRSAQELGQEAVGAIEADSQPLPCGEWRWPFLRQRMRHRGRSVVMICDDRRNESFWVVAAAPEEDELGWMDRLVARWDESDSRVD